MRRVYKLTTTCWVLHTHNCTRNYSVQFALKILKVFAGSFMTVQLWEREGRQNIVIETFNEWWWMFEKIIQS